MTSKDHSSPPVNSSQTEAEEVVREAVSAARTAIDDIRDYDQAAADELATAAAWAIYQDEHAESLIDTTLESTGLGNPADKRAKLRSRVKGILADVRGEPSVGEIPTDREGVVELAKPVGVIGGLVPATNPAPTVANLAILALKGRNALIISTSPSGVTPASEAVEYIRDELAQVGAPKDLVQTLPKPASKAKSNALLNAADLVQVTGSAANVDAGQTSGTPNYCVSEGNPVALVDSSADIEQVARDTLLSASYDNGTACIAESCLVAPTSVYTELRTQLRSHGGYLCNPTETQQLRETLFTDGHLNRDAIGQSAAELAAAAGIENAAAQSADVLLVEPEGTPTDPLVTECLSPVLALLEVPDFTAGIEMTNHLLEREGAGHSVAVHTADREKATQTGSELDVCRLVVNQPNLGSSGTFGNGLTHTYSMGGGTWAGNQLDENLSYRHFIQTTRIAYPTADNDPEPTAADIFSSYDAK